MEYLINKALKKILEWFKAEPILIENIKQLINTTIFQNTKLNIEVLDTEVKREAWKKLFKNQVENI